MQLRLDKETLKVAYETSLKDIEGDIARLAAFLGLDVDEIDPEKFVPDENNFYYINNRPSYALVTTKLKNLEKE